MLLDLITIKINNMKKGLFQTTVAEEGSIFYFVFPSLICHWDRKERNSFANELLVAPVLCSSGQLLLWSLCLAKRCTYVHMLIITAIQMLNMLAPVCPLCLRTTFAIHWSQVRRRRIFRSLIVG